MHTCIYEMGGSDTAGRGGRDTDGMGGMDGSGDSSRGQIWPSERVTDGNHGRITKVTVSVKQEPGVPLHPITSFCNPVSLSMNSTIPPGTPTVMGTLTAGSVTFTMPVKNIAGGVVMFTVVPAPMLQLPAPVDSVMVLLQTFVMVKLCASHGPASTVTTITTAAAAAALVLMPQLIAIALSVDSDGYLRSRCM